MRNIFLLVLVITLFASCSSSHNESKNSVAGTDPVNIEKAEQYVNKAQSLGITPASSADSINGAIVSLDSAIVLNPASTEAFMLKKSYQMWLGDYEGALNTVKTLEVSIPNEPGLKSTEGMLYLLLGNSVPANAAFRSSDSLWNIRLDTASADNDWEQLGMLLGKASNLKLLGKERESNHLYERILKDTLFNKPRYQEIKDTISSVFIRQSREEFFNYLTAGLKGKKAISK